MNDYCKAKRSIIGVVIGLFVFAEMYVPTHAVLFGCCNCCEEDFSPEELTEKISEVNHHFERYKISIEKAREICPQAVKSELERRFMAYGSKLETYLLSDVSHFYILHAHSMLDLDKHCVYFIMGPDRYAYQEIPPDSYEIASNSCEISEQEVKPSERRPSISPTASSSHCRLLTYVSSTYSITEEEENDDDRSIFSPLSSAQLKLAKVIPSSSPRHSVSFSLANPPFSPPTESCSSSPDPSESLSLPKDSSSPVSLSPSCSRSTFPQPLFEQLHPTLPQNTSEHSRTFSLSSSLSSFPFSSRSSPSFSPRPSMSSNSLAGKPTIRVRMKLPEHQKIDLGGFTWNPPFGNINPLEGLIILCGNTDLVNKTCNGNLESSFWGPVGPGGLIYTEHNHSWVRPGDLITTADKLMKGAKRMREKLKKRFNLPDLLRTGKA